MVYKEEPNGKELQGLEKNSQKSTGLKKKEDVQDLNFGTDIYVDLFLQ